MISTRTPDRLYPELFELVQSQHLFADSKTFVDATPKQDPALIVRAFRAAREAASFDLEAFVRSHFELPLEEDLGSSSGSALPVEQRIDELWDVLTRAADEKAPNSSLIPLPNPYVVPGGRFREIYYWDSYFTMLGLAGSGRVGLIQDMVDNFAYLIDEIGYVPNGNRSYYCSRSQPPFFALMVKLLADVKQDRRVCLKYQPQLVREYEFWMRGSDTLNATRTSDRRVVFTEGGLLNRYWDDAQLPRHESYAEDMAHFAASARRPEELFRDVRAACESGWDFSSRWLADGKSMETICTTQIIPIDLNALMFNLESMIAENYRAAGNRGDAQFYETRAESRAELLRSLFFDENQGMFVDLSLANLKSTGRLSIAAAYPLFFGVAGADQAAQVAGRIRKDFLQAGGWGTTLRTTPQQWDLPNGWAPMQWIAFRGLKRYGYHDDARTGASRWVDNNLSVYRQYGRLLEKYDVVTAGTAGAGGEYAVQDGFGWTNAVLLRFMQELDGESPDSGNRQR